MFHRTRCHMPEINDSFVFCTNCDLYIGVWDFTDRELISSLRAKTALSGALTGDVSVESI